MLMLGWWSKSRAANHEGFLLGDRQFSAWMLMMHAFGAGTSPTDVSGTFIKTCTSGVSGIWVSWIWLFGTPFYWIIASLMFDMKSVIVFCLYSPLVALAFPHLMPICGGGNTGWEGRMGFAGGNLLSGALSETLPHAEKPLPFLTTGNRAEP